MTHLVKIFMHGNKTMVFTLAMLRILYKHLRMEVMGTEDYLIKVDGRHRGDAHRVWTKETYGTRILRTMWKDERYESRQALQYANLS